VAEGVEWRHKRNRNTSKVDKLAEGLPALPSNCLKALLAEGKPEGDR
jgi:hypothetical protein